MRWRALSLPRTAVKRLKEFCVGTCPFPLQKQLPGTMNSMKRQLLFLEKP